MTKFDTPKIGLYVTNTMKDSSICFIFHAFSLTLTLTCLNTRENKQMTLIFQDAKHPSPTVLFYHLQKMYQCFIVVENPGLSAYSILVRFGDFFKNVRVFHTEPRAELYWLGLCLEKIERNRERES